MNTLNHILRALFDPRPVFANAATGVHEAGITKTLGESVSTRHLLCTFGGTDDEVITNHADGQPIGVMSDTGAAGDSVNVALLSAHTGTLLMLASEAIAAGSPVYTTDDGYVQGEPEFPGEYYQVGYAVSGAKALNEPIEVMPQAPVKTLVIGAFSGTAATDIATLGAVLAEAPDKVIVLS